MADFLITARISLPDGLIAQAQALAKVAEPIEAFGKALGDVLGAVAKVDVRHVRRPRGSTAPNPDKPKRERKPKTPAPQGDLGIPPKPPHHPPPFHDDGHRSGSSADPA